MNIYLINDCFRIDGITGRLLEEDFIEDFIKYNKIIELETGRNQYVSFQMIFETDNEKIDELEIEYSDLCGNGFNIAGAYESYIEWFHNIDGRYVPDALIPLNVTELEFKVPLDEKYLKNQKAGAIWLDLFIPKETVPGEYKGNITVKVNGSEKKEFGILVKVHNMELCDKSKIYVDLNSYADTISPFFPKLKKNNERYTDGSYIEIEKEFHKMANNHRCVFHLLPYDHSGYVFESFAPQLEGEGKNLRVKSWELFDQHFGPYLDGSAFENSQWETGPLKFLYLPFNFAWPASYEKWGKKGYRTEFRKILTEFVRHFEEKGWKDTCFELYFNHKKRYRYFPYDGDETRFEEDNKIFNLFYSITKDIFEETDVKFVMRMDSSWLYGRHFDSKYADMAKMWVVNKKILSWYPESVPIMKKKGNIMFFYRGLSDLSESLLVILTRNIECIMMGVDGYTLWNTTGFGEDYMNIPLAMGSQAVWYPGVNFGYDKPIPSIRLKVMRNCMQITDMIKSVEGTSLMEEARKVCNRYYQTEDNSWWDEKPGYVDEPPHTWTNAKLSEVKVLRNFIVLLCFLQQYTYIIPCSFQSVVQFFPKWFIAVTQLLGKIANRTSSRAAFGLKICIKLFKKAP